MSKQRNLEVQTPGAAPTPDPQDDVQVIETAGAGPTIEELHARIAELEAENAKKAAVDPESMRKAVAEEDAAFERAGRSLSRASRDKFLDMRAHQVDPTILVAAVLTKDGWVAPDQSGQKGKE